MNGTSPPPADPQPAAPTGGRLRRFATSGFGRFLTFVAVSVGAAALAYFLRQQSPPQLDDIPPPSAPAVPEVGAPGPKGGTPAKKASPPTAIVAKGDIDALPSAPTPAQDSIPNGDLLVLEGRFDQALPIFQRLGARAASPAREILRYRTALCLEGLGRWDEAMAAYRELAGQGPYTAATVAAQLGQARLWLRQGRSEEARAALYPLHLRSAEPPLRNRPAMAEVQYLLALALLRDALHGTGEAAPAPTLLRGATVGPAGIDYELSRALDWAAPVKSQAGPVADVFAVHRFGTGPADGLLSAVGPEETVVRILEKLAGANQWGLEWSPAARGRAEGRRARLMVARMPLADVLRDLTDPLGLAWKVEAGKLTLRAASEVSGKEAADLRVQAARRAVREAVFTDPRHPLSAPAVLEAGNVEAAEQRLDAAAAWYEQLMREDRYAAYAAEASYDLGLARKQQGEVAKALEAFHRVIDQAPGGELAPWAGLWVGRLFLEQGLHDRAVTTLRRAAAAAGHRAQAPAVLHLAAAHLLAGNAKEAHQVLLRHRTLLSEEGTRPVAALLDALARVRLSSQGGAASAEAFDLLAALLARPGDDLLGPVGVLLTGQGYRALGMRARMAELYEAALPTLKGPLAEEMTFALAAHRLEAPRGPQDRTAGAKMFDALATQTGSRWAAPAQFYLARVALQEDRPRECLDRCQRLLREPGSVARGEVLDLLGRCYTQMGEHRLAARCFAGEAP